MKAQIRFKDLSVPLKIAAIGGFVVVIIWIITLVTTFIVGSYI